MLNSECDCLVFIVYLSADSLNTCVCCGLGAPVFVPVFVCVALRHYSGVGVPK